MTEILLSSNGGWTKTFFTEAKNIHAAIVGFLKAERGCMTIPKEERDCTITTKKERIWVYTVKDTLNYYFCTMYVNEKGRLRFAIEY